MAKLGAFDSTCVEEALPEISAIFWDVGGCLLTNAWDRTQRTAALAKFGLDEAEFHDRHEMVVSSLERGKIGLDEYLDRTVFYRDRPFTKQAFKQYIFSLSQPDDAALKIARALAAARRYLLGTINNESLDLNLYRIQKFGLRDIFTVFISSCFVGLRKPEKGIYRVALEICQKPADQCCFIDDRSINLEAARRLGMHAIEMTSPAQLSQELSKLGVPSAT
jgi:putative hydrolase of the HAD superfamily